MMTKGVWIIRGLLLFLGSTFSDSSFSQIFTGRVTDHEKAAGLPSANISVRGKSVGGITDRDGNFSVNISGASLTDSIVISHLGYESLTIPKKQVISKFYNITLSPISYQLDEVIALGKRRMVITGNKQNKQR